MCEELISFIITLKLKLKHHYFTSTSHQMTQPIIVGEPTNHT
jgi:hypothetical protein